MVAQAIFSRFALIFDVLWVLDNSYCLYSRFLHFG